MAARCIWSDEKPDIPIATGTVLLFSFQSLRDAQPGVPDIGSVGDITGYFWNLAIVAVFTMVLVVWWVIRRGELDKVQIVTAGELEMGGRDRKEVEKVE